MAKEEEILSAFGLPESLKFCKVLHKLSNRKSVTVAVIQKTIGNLQQTAEKYHNRPVVSSLETLTLAQQKKLNALDVLPELGFITHTYTIFLYDDLLLEILFSADSAVTVTGRISWKMMSGLKSPGSCTGFPNMAGSSGKNQWLYPHRDKPLPNSIQSIQPF